MMLIGLGLSKMENLFRPDWSFLRWMFSIRFVVWPLAMAAVVAADVSLFHLYGHDIHFMMLLIGMVPMAANTVAFAETLGLSAENAASAVLLSTLFALFFIPAGLSFWTF